MTQFVIEFHQLDNDELLQLWVERGQLTGEATEALRKEIRRRDIANEVDVAVDRQAVAPEHSLARPVQAYPHDTPKGLWSELQASIVRTSIGRIALAVVLAQAVLSFIRILVWDLVMPIVASLLHHQTDSVLFEQYRGTSIRWDYVLNSLLQLGLAVIFVLFVNRWIRQKPSALNVASSVSEGGTPDEQSAIGHGAGREDT